MRKLKKILTKLICDDALLIKIENNNQTIEARGEIFEVSCLWARLHYRVGTQGYLFRFRSDTVEHHFFIAYDDCDVMGYIDENGERQLAPMWKQTRYDPEKLSSVTEEIYRVHAKVVEEYKNKN